MNARRCLWIFLLVPVLGLARTTPLPTGAIGSAQACPIADGVTTTARPCCKACSKGKACGDSCIARDKVCHQPPGCACDG